MNAESINNNSERIRDIVFENIEQTTSSLSQEEILNMETNGFLDMDQLDNLSREMDLILSKKEKKMTETEEKIIETSVNVEIQLEEPTEPLFIKSKFDINNFELLFEFDKEDDIYSDIDNVTKRRSRICRDYDKSRINNQKAKDKLNSIITHNIHSLLVELKVCTGDYSTSGVIIHPDDTIRNFYYVTQATDTSLNIRNKYHSYTVDIRDINIYKIPDGTNSVDIIKNIDKDLSVINPKCDINKYLKFKNPNLYQALIEVFEDKQWGVFFNDDESYTINIHFPVINITNSNNRKHTIFDIIVKLRFNKNNEYLQFLATKATILEKEIINQDYCYIHSHIQKLNKTYITSPEDAGIGFCLGDGTPISFQNRLLINLKGKVTFENYMGFLLSIKPYLEWESLEGVPFQKISDLIDNNKWSVVNINDVYSVLIYRIKSYLRNTPSRDIISALSIDGGKDFKLFSSGKEIKISIKNIDFLYTLFSFSATHRELENCKLKFINGQYYKESGSSSSIQRDKINSFKQSLKDEKIYISNNYFLPVVVKENTDDFSKIEKTVPAEIINNLNEDLSHILNSM